MERKNQLNRVQEESYHMPDSYDEPAKRDDRLKVSRRPAAAGVHGIAYGTLSMFTAELNCSCSMIEACCYT